jgi:hypothetical protein
MRSSTDEEMVFTESDTQSTDEDLGSEIVPDNFIDCWPDERVTVSFLYRTRLTEADEMKKRRKDQQLNNPLF